MKKFIYLVVFLLSFFGCNKEVPTQFSTDALNDTFVSIDGESVPFKTILDKHKGKTIVVNVWASWCSDCIKGMPKFKTLQKDFNNTDYVFLSLDKSLEAWKRGIKKYDLSGEHYFMQSGWKGPFGNFVKLKWIPRYMVINEQGNIELFKAVKADDNKLIEALKK